MTLSAVLWSKIIHKLHGMSLSKPMLVKMKRDLLGARITVQEAAATARRAADAGLAKRLRGIADQMANELDYLEGQIAQLP